MSTAHTPTKAQKSRKEKDKDKENERKASLPQQNERLKTVVRRLPPNLPEDIFWQSVQPWVTEESALWKLYCPGKLRKKLNKENVPSRAYIAFKDEEKLALFSREYDGHVFRDKSGVESHAVVEFAPYPKIPSEKRKPDPRNATIEKDEDYISFLETLKAAENPEPVTLESLIAASQPAPPPKTTPLLEALKAEKSANKDKEAILRNHAHYNSMTVTSLRKEEKKKAAAAAAPPAKPEPSVPLQTTGKKAQKKAQAQAPVSQTAKAAQQATSAPAPKGGANVNAPATAAKPAKPPRPSRGQAKAAAAAAAANEATKPPTILAPPSTETAVATAPAAAAAPAPAAATTRRTRPVIGLANRQFEAALSGVSGLANAATERKKREKEREAQAVAGGGSVPPTPAATATATTTFARIDGSDTEKPPSPTSPKKEKTRRGGRGGGGGSGGGAAAAPQVKVPSILQRAPDAAAAPVPQQVALTAPAAAPGGAAPANAAAGGNAPGGAAGGGAARGGGRRGRGGGRGRGGAPNAPRGGG